ncbi:hypothetical protein [Halomontanus rarus]|uniref:hypothetical protein n=1 Tax=Halomontanus rarus TaxID=3034020 RepID=UPI00307C5730
MDDLERFQFILSYLETRPSVRALRFQSIYSFYRSMVVAAWIVIGLSILSFVFYCTGWVAIRGPPTSAVVVAFSLILLYSSLKRRNKLEKTFVGYVVREYYLEQLEENGELVKPGSNSRSK